MRDFENVKIQPIALLVLVCEKETYYNLGEVV